MSINRRVASGFAGVLDIDRQLVHANGVYQMVQSDDVVVQGTGADVLLPVTRPPTALQPGADLTIDLLYIVQADTLACTVQGGPNTINGAASILVPGNSFCQFVWDGSQWLAALSGGSGDGPLAGDCVGPEGANVVVGLQTVPVSAVLPLPGQVLTFDPITLEWQGDTLPASGTVLQTLFDEVTVDTSTLSFVYTDLIADGATVLSVTPTVLAGSHLVIWFDASASNSAALDEPEQVSFQVLVDGVPVRGTALTTSTENFEDQVNSCALSYKTGPLAAGAHTVSVQWHTDDISAQIRPNVAIEEHASLTVQEVTS